MNTFYGNQLNGKRILTTDDFVSGPTGATGASFAVNGTGGTGSIIVSDTEGRATTNSVLTVDGSNNIVISGNMIPSIGNVFSVGTPSLRFRQKRTSIMELL